MPQALTARAAYPDGTAHHFAPIGFVLPKSFTFRPLACSVIASHRGMLVQTRLPLLVARQLAVGGLGIGRPRVPRSRGTSGPSIEG